MFIPFVPDMIAVQKLIPESFSFTLDSVTIVPGNVLSGNGQQNSFWQVLIWIYVSGLFFGLIRLSIQLWHIFILIQRTGIRRQQGVKVVYTGKPYANFSFFNIVFLNSTSNEGGDTKQIFDHEKTHIQQRHYLDLVFVELLTILFWFNPVIWFYKHSLKTVHEYLADEGVLAAGYLKEPYQKLLLDQTFGIQLYALTNNLNKSLIKRRFVMMLKQKRNSQTIFKTMLVVPLMLLIAFVVSCNSEDLNEELKEAKEIIEVKNGQTDIFTVVEEMPTFPGGDEARMKYLVENIRYPEVAQKNGIQGRVFITFVVEEDGYLSNVKVLRGIGGGCDEEAVRVIENMPKWEPGKQNGKAVRVQFNMPIMFKLD
ncbi:MAG: M56 family metallopeptidase [Chlorobi bacterium]|nr:M56 family metallopeptidase [Chlorobiota bacterium]